MIGSVAVALVLFTAFWLYYRHRLHAEDFFPERASSGIYDFYRPRLGSMLFPIAIQFWECVSIGINGTAEGIRKIYTGNGQSYALYVLYYFIALYLLNNWQVEI